MAEKQCNLLKNGGGYNGAIVQQTLSADDTFTAPSNGFVVITSVEWDGWAKASYVSITRDGVTTTIKYSANDENTGAGSNISFPVKLGDYLVIHSGVNTTISQFPRTLTFFPY